MIEDRQQASFRNFLFLVPSSRITDGRKTVVHEFVNSDNRFVEDLGRFQPQFKITAIIHGPNALQLKDDFRAELNKPGVGTLVHPSFGSQQVVVTGPYSVSDEDASLGQYTFEITFALSSGANFPQIGQQATPSSVASLELTARDSILQRLSDQWEVPITSLSNLDASTKLSSFAEGVASNFSGIVADSSAIVAEVESVVNSSSSIVRAGSSVAEAVEGILLTLDNIPTESFATLTADKSFLDFGSADSVISNKFGLSLDQTKRKLNRDLLNSAVQSTMLVKAFTTSSLIDFQLVERLDENRSDLAVSSRDIISTIRDAGVEFDAASAAGVSISSSRDRQAVSAILDTQSQSEKVMAAKEQNLYRVVNIKQPLTSSRLLSHQLFETDDQAEIISDLNKGQRPSDLSGNIEVVNA